MALIEKIRRQGWLVLVMVGLGIVGYLIPYDAVMALFGNSSSSIGVIDGQSINPQEWQIALEERKPLFQYEGNQNSLFTDTWTQLTEDIIYQDEYEKLGIQISEEEYEEIVFGKYLSPYVKSTIYGGKDSASFKEQMRTNFDQMPPALVNGTNVPMQSLWKDLIIKKRQKEKYDAMLKKGAYANSIDAKWAFKMSNDKATIDYVVKSYAEIPDSSVTVTESDIKAYYQEHKNDREYKQDVSRSLEYISFPVQPSSTDSMLIKESLSTMASEFRVAKNDSAYSAGHAQSPNMGSVEYNSNNLPEPWNSQLMNDSIGKVVGPYMEGQTMKIAKISKRSMEIDSVSAKHILVKEKGPKGKAKADSIKNVIAKENNFAIMAARYSEDPSNKDKGGDLGSFTRTTMVKPFADACFNGSVGQLQVVETSFGWHIIEVTKKNSPKLITRIAVVDKKIEASQKTVRSAFTQANEFTINFSDTASFRNAADTLNGKTIIYPVKNVKPNATTLGSLQNASAVVEWAYSAEVGEISQPKLIDNQYIIAALIEVKESGAPTLKNVYDVMKVEATKLKKAELYMDKMKTGTLEEIATAANSQIKNAENVTMKANSIPSSGISTNENEVMGAIFGLKTGTMTSPIKGKGGVYVIRRAADIVPGTSADNYLTDQTQANTSYQNRIINSVFNAFKESASIEDNRYVRR
jgi:peptidyl-prolyl cis-trans isomerase D